MTQRTFRPTILAQTTMAQTILARWVKTFCTHAALVLIASGACVGTDSVVRAANTTAPSNAAKIPSTPMAPPVEAMSAMIAEVHGLVQYRESDSDTWHNAVERMQISQGGELRTGPHSSVTCVIPPDQAFTLDRLGTVRVEEAARNGNKISTDLVMKYGRTHYQIESAGLEHEAKISSPSSTLAVRGTVISLYDQPPYTPEATSYTGRAVFTYNRNPTPVGQHHGKTTKVRGSDNGASETALNDTVVDPQSAVTRTEADASLIATEVSRGAVLSFDPIANIPVITNGRPSTDAEISSVLPSKTGLDFVLRWTGNADLNLEVAVDQKDSVLTAIVQGFKQTELLYPGFGLQNTASGGHIPFDNRGGPTGGEEFAYYPAKHPTGLYGVAVLGVSGKSTAFTLDAYSNGKLLTQFFPDGASLESVKSTQFTRSVAPGNNFTFLIPVPAYAPLEAAVPNDPLGSPNPSVTSSTATASIARHTPSIHPALTSRMVKVGK